MDDLENIMCQEEQHSGCVPDWGFVGANHIMKAELDDHQESPPVLHHQFFNYKVTIHHNSLAFDLTI